MACRVLPKQFPPERMLARRRNSNVSRSRYNKNNINPNLKKILNTLRPRLNEEEEEEENSSGSTSGRGGGAGRNCNNRTQNMHAGLMYARTRRKNRRFGAGYRRKTHTK